MRLIQFILLAGFFFSFFVYLRFLRSSLRDRLLGLVLFLIAFTAVAVPDITQMIAEYVGVGRGADLALYLFTVVSVFVAVLFYSKLSRQQRLITELIRVYAVNEGLRVDVAK
jgi:hypothetical protein